MSSASDEASASPLGLDPAPLSGAARYPAKSIFREYVEALLIAVLLATFARTFVVQAFKIPSGSMEENLLVGDHILVNKFVFGSPDPEAVTFALPMQKVRRGDVVVFKYPLDPDRDFIKRCVGLPGDKVEIVRKELFVDDQRVDESGYVHHADPRVFPPSDFLAENHRLRDNFGPFVVPEESYFCLGDNRDHSNDSRFWGSVPAEYIKGRAVAVYWSFETAEESPEWLGVRDNLGRLGRMIRDFRQKTRWERTLKAVR